MSSFVGDVINFRGLVYGPVNELGVIFLFSKINEELGIRIEEIGQGFPDAIGAKKTSRGWVRRRIEFEFLSSHFKEHGHPEGGCDIIICWEHNWPECLLEVVELKTIIEKLPNQPITPNRFKWSQAGKKAWETRRRKALKKQNG